MQFYQVVRTYDVLNYTLQEFTFNSSSTSPQLHARLPLVKLPLLPAHIFPVAKINAYINAFFRPFFGRR